MSVVHIKKQVEADSPLDIFEDLLEGSQYAFERQSRTRLCFECGGKCGSYGIILEWNAEMRAMRVHIVMTQTRSYDRDRLMVHIETANDHLWRGYFAVDGVGHTIFKTVKEIASYGDTAIIQDIESILDDSLAEVDRLWTILGLGHQDSDDLFGDTEWDVENLSLLLSDPKGSA